MLTFRNHIILSMYIYIYMYNYLHISYPVPTCAYQNETVGKSRFQKPPPMRPNEN